MAAPSGTVWLTASYDIYKLGFYVTTSNSGAQTNVTIQTWLWTKYELDDSDNVYYFNVGTTSATTAVKSDISFSHTNTSSWSTSNQTMLGSHSYTYTRTTSSQTIKFAAKIGPIGSSARTAAASSSFTIPALDSYTISYDANGGSGAPSSQSKWYGINITLSSSMPTKTGYSFSGWSTSSAATTVNYAAGATFGLNADTTLYAVWKANTYTVTYDANGGSGAPSSQTKTYNVALTLSSTKPTRANYNFVGWGTSATSTTVAYAAGASYTTNAAITLYAIWEVAYSAPTISYATLSRCDSSGTVSDTGTYFKIEFTWETYLTVSSVTVRWKETSATSWTSSDISASGTSGSVSQVLGSGAISNESSYDVEIIVADASGSSSMSRILPGTAYLIDFLNGGGGVAIGKPAETKNLFDVNWATRLRSTLTVDDSISAASANIDGSFTASNAEVSGLEVTGTGNIETANITTGNITTSYVNALYDKYNTKFTNGVTIYTSEGIDPDTTLDHLILTSTNTPNGGFMYIKTEFYSTKSTTSNRMQTAFPYKNNGCAYFRYYASSAWSSWMPFGMAIKPGDTFTVPSGLQILGIISGSSTSIAATLYLGTPIVATSIALSGNFVVRGDKGYLNSMDYTTGVAVNASGYTCTASIYDAARGVINLRLTKSSAFTNVTNNTPVSITGANNTALVLTFS